MRNRAARRRWKTQVVRRRREILFQAIYGDLDEKRRGQLRDGMPVSRWTGRELSSRRTTRWPWLPAGRFTKRLISRRLRQRARAELRTQIEQ